MFLRNRTQLTSLSPRIKRSRPVQSSQQLFAVEWAYVFSDERFSGNEYPFIKEEDPLIFSDNGKTFIRANAELKRLYKLVINPDPELAGFLVNENINWKFFPPRAPNFGGLWEAGVKSFKFHFKREAGNSRFTYEEFLTIMTQIEEILNSRPLTPLSTDIDDLSVLTPAHFLIERPITSISEPNIIHIETNRLNIYQSGGSIMSSTKRKEKIKCLSRNTVATRVDEIAENLRDQHLSTISTFQAYSIAIDESTDIRNIAQLAIFISGCHVNLKINELLDAIHMHNTTTGADIFDSLMEVVKKYKLPLDKLVCLATDVAPAMTDITKRVVARLKETSEQHGNNNFIPFYYIIHQ
ncbi:general transcription factor II-I repeat domain-containing protein 2 [Trichonephila clavipes]|nr:general transcription factor II-I repeat domain-containing protein 2 [Trichonephila clavipes]